MFPPEGMPLPRNPPAEFPERLSEYKLRAEIGPQQINRLLRNLSERCDTSCLLGKPVEVTGIVSR